MSRSARWILGLGFPIALLAVASCQADPRAGLSLLAEAGPWCLLALLPFGVMLAADLIGWRLLFAPGHAAMLAVAALLAAARPEVPAGLVAALLRVVSAPEAAAVGVAFVLLKRLKELVWVGAGWSLLLAADGRAEEVRREQGREAPDPVRLRLDQPDDADAPGRPRAARA